MRLQSCLCDVQSFWGQKIKGKIACWLNFFPGKWIFSAWCKNHWRLLLCWTLITNWLFGVWCSIFLWKRSIGVWLVYIDDSSLFLSLILTFFNSQTTLFTLNQILKVIIKLVYLQVFVDFGNLILFRFRVLYCFKCANVLEFGVFIDFWT